MKKIIVFSLIFIFSILENLAFGQSLKEPLIMKTFPLKTDAKVYRLARDNSPVIAHKKAGSKILVVKEKDTEWMIVQIGGINAYLRKEAIEMGTKSESPYMINCPDITMYLPGRIAPTGFRHKRTFIISNRDFRNMDMNQWILRN